MASSYISTSAFEKNPEFGNIVLNDKILKPLDDVLRCRICREYFTNCMITRCSHNYCSVCIRRYMNYKSQCPICFKSAAEPELQNNRLVDEILRTYLKIRESLHIPLDNASSSYPEQSNSSKSTSKGSTEDLKKAGTSVDNNSNQQDDDIASNEVSCPVCYTTVPSDRINIHLDICLKQSEERSQRKFLPKLVYHLMSEKEIRKKLKEHGLSTSGNKQTLIRRHKTFITLFNANCDSLHPKPVSDLLLEIEQQELEEKVNAAQKSMQTNKKSDPSVIEKEHESYVEEHQSQFSALIQDVQQRALAGMRIKQEGDDAEVFNTIIDDSGNVIGESILRVGSASDLESVTVKKEPLESSLEDPVIIKEEPPDSGGEDPCIRYDEALNIKSEICDSDSDASTEYMDIGNKSSHLPYRIKKDLPVRKIKEEPQFLLDPKPNQAFNPESPSSLDKCDTNKMSINKLQKKKYARRLSTEEKNSQRKK